MHHPLSPALAGLGVALGAAVSARWPRLWLAALPALLPVASLAPWTGWIAFDEFDLVVLAAIAGTAARHGFGRQVGLAADLAAVPAGAPPAARRGPRAGVLWMLGFAVFSTTSLVRGLLDSGPAPFGWFQGEADPLNTLRLFKPVLYGLALWPMTCIAVRGRGAGGALRRTATGMVAGLAAVSLLALGERALYPGWLDFTEPYRITVAFWEMHVGGAALDFHLVLTAPFALWALCTARSARRWTAAAALALLATHAVLTTFSRGVYLGVALPLAALLAWQWRALSARRAAAAPRRISQRRTVAVAALVAALTVEIVAVFGPASFMRERVAAGQRDFDSRLDHWRRGLALLHTPVDALLGIGLGRLPVHYAAEAPHREFSGRLEAPRRAGDGATLRGPATSRRLESHWGLTQRVSLGSGGPYRVELSLQGTRPVALDVFVCEMHLLYARHCRSAALEFDALDAAPGSAAAARAVRTGHAVLEGVRLSPGPLRLRQGVFWVSVANRGGEAVLDHIRLTDERGTELIANGRFVDGLARWWPVAVDDFVPWHLDNLVLELLVERGGLAALCFLGWVVCALRGAAEGSGGGPVSARPFFVAAVAGALVTGSVSSLFDVPRVTLLLSGSLMLLVALQQPPKRPATGLFWTRDCDMPMSAAILQRHGPSLTK